MTRCADTGRVPPARGVMVSAAAFPAGLRTNRTLWPCRTDWTGWTGWTDYTRIFIFIITAGLLIVTVILTVIAIAIVGTSHIGILSAHIITSFVNFGEAPLHYMLFFDEQILTLMA